MLDPCENENDDIQDDDMSLGADFVQRDEHSESVSEDLDINESHNKPNHVEFQKIGINRDMSTCGMLHSIGSDLTHTWGKSETHQNGSIRSKQNGLRARDYGNTPQVELSFEGIFVNSLEAKDAISSECKEDLRVLPFNWLTKEAFLLCLRSGESAGLSIDLRRELKERQLVKLLIEDPLNGGGR
ncbi:Meiosis-specific protein ASY1 [Camellia lanceoleosa]|uniref:Meiosis-specific protein ASY1 n=1 Tax=Camellia lanceoleosa TaxID=1840588 RepID=A0ACC0IUF5_9ERIC|nr:Meiosis-specific protein ASY1 [Camellia lanceoleosa]